MNFIKKLFPLFLISLALYGQGNKNIKLGHPLRTEGNKEPYISSLSGAAAQPETSISILAVMVEFQEDSDNRTSGNGTFDLTVPVKRTLGAPPHDRTYFQNHLKFLENYFLKVSDGKLSLTPPKLLDSVYRLPHPMRDYSPARSSVANTELGNLMRDTWRLVDSLAAVWDLNIPYEQFNTFLIFHAGVGRDIDLVSIYGYDPTPFDIPSIYLDTTSLAKMNPSWASGIPVGDSSFFITNSIIAPETESREEVPFPLSINGLLAASVGSRLGLPDLFDTKTGSTGIGRFGLMDGQSIFSWNGAFPPEPSAWEKVYLGWTSPVVVSSGDSTYHFPAVGLPGNPDTVFKVLITGKEYFLVENRNRDANRDGATVTMAVNGETVVRTWAKDTAHFNEDRQDSLYGVITDVDEFDWSLPGGFDTRSQIFYDGGLLIWHIDETIIYENLATNTVNADPTRRGVNLMEADGSQDIGQSYEFLQAGSGSENGTALDFWYKGNKATLRKNFNAFTPASNPDSRSNGGANSHIYIGNRTKTDTAGFSDRGPRMYARIKVGDDIVMPLPGFPKNSVESFGNRSVKVWHIPDSADFPGGFLVNTSGFGSPVSSPFETRLSDGIPGIYGWKFDGSPLIQSGHPDGLLMRYGLPQPAPAEPGFSLAVGNLNQDDYIEFTAGAGAAGGTGRLTAWSGADLDGDTLADELFGNEIQSGISTHPVISDLLIAYGTDTGELYLLRRDGAPDTTIQFGEPGNLSVTHLCLFTNPNLFAVVTSDGSLHLTDVACPDSPLNLSPAELQLHASFAISTLFASGSPKYIIVCSMDGYLSVLDPCSRAPLKGFPVATGDSILNAPAAADIDGDGRKEIIVFSGNKIFAVSEAGVIIDNFPVNVNTSGPIPTSPVVADVDADGTNDIVGVTREGLIVAYNKAGKMAEGFPIQSGINNGSTPAVFYLPGGYPGAADVCLSVASDDGYIYAWKTGQTDAGGGPLPRMPWPQYMHDARNSGSDESVLVRNPRSDQFFPQSLAYNWPNPVGAADGFKTNIRYYVAEDAAVHIKIFDTAGDLVTEFDGPGTGGLDNEAVWDVSEIQSGIYLARIEASRAGKNGYAIIKIAVVR